MPQLFKTVKSVDIEPKPKLLLFGFEPSHAVFTRNYFEVNDSIAVGRVSFIYNETERFIQ